MENNLAFYLELATLSQAQLMDKVKDLMEIAYQLGEEECKFEKKLI